MISILGVLIMLGSFEVWKYNQEKYEKFLAQKKAKCSGTCQEINVQPWLVNSWAKRDIRFIRLDIYFYGSPQEEMNSAYYFVSRSRTLNGIRLRLVNQEKISVQQPGINNQPIRTNDTYVLMYTEPHALIPESPSYDDKFFVGLATKSDTAPPPLMVYIVSAKDGVAEISTQCSPILLLEKGEPSFDSRLYFKISREV